MRISKVISDTCKKMRACDICEKSPKYGSALPHRAKPIFQLGAGANICIAGQAPGNKAHQRGLPFCDPSGQRLREWLGVTEQEFYDPEIFAIIPMGFCFPGYDKNGGDLPPRKECVDVWHDDIFQRIQPFELVLSIGQYSQRYHLAPERRHKRLTDTVANWQAILEDGQSPTVFPLPHPSWRNTAWLKKNPWFEREAIPALQSKVHQLIR